MLGDQARVRADRHHAGFIFSAFAYPYLLFQIIGGMTADKFGPRKTLFISGLVWAGATILTGLATGLTSLFLGRVLMGFGVGATLPTATRAMQHWVEPQRGFAQGITHSFSRLGNSLTPIMVVAIMAPSAGAARSSSSGSRASLGDRLVSGISATTRRIIRRHAGRTRKAAAQGREARPRGRSLGTADRPHVACDADLFLLRLVPLAVSSFLPIFFKDRFSCPTRTQRCSPRSSISSARSATRSAA